MPYGPEKITTPEPEGDPKEDPRYLKVLEQLQAGAFYEPALRQLLNKRGQEARRLENDAREGGGSAYEAEVAKLIYLKTREIADLIQDDPGPGLK